MDNFKAVYKILSTLEKMMDIPEADASLFSAEKLGVTQQRWACYLEMMIDVGYIKGASVFRDVCGEMDVDVQDIRITLKGLEYLQENSMMQKIYRAAKGIKEVTPGI